MHFTLAVNRAVKWHQLRSRAQHIDRDVEEYAAALRCLRATNRKFGSLTEEVIRDLIEICCHTDIKDRLLLEPELTLQNAVRIAKQVEQAIHKPAFLAPRSAHEHHNVSAVWKDKQGKRYTQEFYRCVSSQYFANSTTCPAKKNTCRNVTRKDVSQLSAEANIYKDCQTSWAVSSHYESRRC